MNEHSLKDKQREGRKVLMTEGQKLKRSKDRKRGKQEDEVQRTKDGRGSYFLRGGAGKGLAKNLWGGEPPLPHSAGGAGAGNILRVSAD